nr:glycosyltransferase [Stenotrophomonas sp. MMGLT7]
MHGGSEFSCLELASELLKNDVNVCMLALNDPSKGVEIFEYCGVRIKKIPLWNIFWPFSAKKRNLLMKVFWNLIDLLNIPMAIRVVRLVKSEGGDILHTNNIKGVSPWIFCACRLLGVRVIHTTRDFYLLDRQSWYRGDHNRMGLVARMELTYKRWLSRPLKSVVFNSKYMLNAHANFAFFEKANRRVIYNGFAVNSVNEGIRQRESRVAGYIGRFSKEKGIDVLIDSFYRGKRGTKLIIAGGFRDDFLEIYPEMESKVKDLMPWIDFVGYMKSSDFYDMVDCIVVPSSYNEPFGRVAMEAIIRGLPVVVSNKGGLPEQIKSSRFGVVCNDGEFYSCVRMIFDEYSNYGDVNNDDILEFSISYSAKSYMRAYSDLLSAG